ncbi:hypothetical protein [Fictibacillus phosphorivorans]|uniref:hypothetical protein n=1 Tax=Fictibacillus phosphorivorans TaxID=1221500 RepID=UPI00203B0451|nr:hypothetical protein [Fictibacillus phosphorivorans]MCM3718509.1 hypothetical protein [Fictibacillus phosphorivorans]MCM3776135.1 hypothetical protein [Fictibacillus phosphorivorans]
MDFYPSRKNKHRKFSRKSKKRFLIITNLWLLYLIMISVLLIPNSTTYLRFNDTEQIVMPIAASADFCSDSEFKKKNKNICKKKDNSGIGNGPENGDDGEYGDPDNPGKGNGDKKDCLPNECIDDHPNKKNPKQPPHGKKDNQKESTEDTEDKRDSVIEPELSPNPDQNEKADEQNNEPVNASELPEESEQTQ